MGLFFGMFTNFTNDLIWLKNVIAKSFKILKINLIYMRHPLVFIIIKINESLYIMVMTSRRKTFIVPKVGCQNTCKASFAGYFNIADSLIKNKVQNICWYVLYNFHKKILGVFTCIILRPRSCKYKWIIAGSEL